MYNELLHIGPITIYGYGFMMAFGIIAGYIAAEKRAKTYQLDPERILPFVLWGVVGGLAGAKLLFYLTQIKEILENPSILLDISNGFVVYGSIIGGLGAVLLYCKIKKLPMLRYCDLLFPSVALGQAFGRIGCFLAGCCYGKVTESPIGIVFHQSAYAPNGVSLLPTQLISSGLNFVHFFLLIWYAKHKKHDGQVSALYLICYSVGRFVLEFFRGDLERGSVGTLSTSQFIAIFMCIAGVLFWVIGGKVKKEVEV